MIVIEEDPKLTFNEDKHLYFYDKIPVPGVTALLKEYGLVDLSGIPEDRLNYKRILGTAVDYACHLLIERRLDEDTLDGRIIGYVDAFRKFCEVTGFEATHSKQKLYSRTWGFAGEFDLAGSFTLNKKFYEVALLDIKCTWNLYPSNGIQTAAYQIPFEENYKTKINGRFALQLKENGSFEIEQYTDFNDRNVFLSCLSIHKWREKNGLLKKERL